MAYRFRLRFHLPHDTNIELDDPLVEIPASLPDGAPYVLKAVGEKPIRETDALIINSRGFPTEEEAAAAAEEAKAPLLCSRRFRGKDRWGSRARDFFNCLDTCSSEALRCPTKRSSRSNCLALYILRRH